MYALQTSSPVAAPLAAPDAAGAAAVPAKKKSKDKESSLEDLTPLTLDEEKQLRVSHACTQVDINMQREVDSYADSIAFFSIGLVQLHYALQMSQMAHILKLPTHVSVSHGERLLLYESLAVAHMFGVNVLVSACSCSACRNHLLSAILPSSEYDGIFPERRHLLLYLSRLQIRGASSASREDDR